MLSLVGKATQQRQYVCYLLACMKLETKGKELIIFTDRREAK